MKFHWQKISILLGILLASGVNNLWSTDVHRTGCGSKVLSDTVPPVDNSNQKVPFKNKFQYNKDGKISHIETEDYNIKIEYDTRCNKQVKSTRIKKETGDSIVYSFTYDASCQLSAGESSDGIKLGFKFDSKQRLITIIQSSRKINIVYNDSSLPKKISLGNRDYLDNIYDSSGKIMYMKGFNTWWHPTVGTFRVLKIMYHMIEDTETLFNRLLKFKPGLNMAEIRFLFNQLAERPPFIDWDM
ncbi:MAG: hypothetical protein ABIR30_06670 [Chitinophagaceae bacterium]